MLASHDPHCSFIYLTRFPEVLRFLRGPPRYPQQWPLFQNYGGVLYSAACLSSHLQIEGKASSSQVFLSVLRACADLGHQLGCADQCAPGLFVGSDSQGFRYSKSDYEYGCSMPINSCVAADKNPSSMKRSYRIIISTHSLSQGSCPSS